MGKSGGISHAPSRPKIGHGGDSTVSGLLPCKPATKSMNQLATQPNSRYITWPVSKFTCQLVSHPGSHSVAQPVRQAASHACFRSVRQSVSLSNRRPVSQPLVQIVVQSLAQPFVHLVFAHSVNQWLSQPGSHSVSRLASRPASYSYHSHSLINSLHFSSFFTSFSLIPPHPLSLYLNLSQASPPKNSLCLSE